MVSLARSDSRYFYSLKIPENIILSQIYLLFVSIGTAGVEWTCVKYKCTLFKGTLSMTQRPIYVGITACRVTGVLHVYNLLGYTDQL